MKLVLDKNYIISLGDYKVCSSKCFAKSQKVSLQEILTARAEYGESKGEKVIKLENDVQLLASDIDYLEHIVSLYQATK